MKSSILSTSLFLSLAAAAPSWGPPSWGPPSWGQPPQRCPPKPAYFLLAGDSTTATQRDNVGNNGGGWGDGFLNYTLTCGSTGHNYGHNGATTVSFRAGGDWATVLSQIQAQKDKYDVYVTIQFGHNDQKVTANISLAQYTVNLKTFTDEVKAAGGIPILVTSLTRRSFSTPTNLTIPLVAEDLNTQRILTIEAAIATNSRYIDLNAASTLYCDEIGPTACHQYNLFDNSGDVNAVGIYPNGTSVDNTHLNVHGSVVFGRLVSDLLVAKYQDIAAVTQPNATLSAELADGVPA